MSISCILRGGLSNNLFIMAATMAHSLKTGIDYCIPLKVENPHYPEQKPYIFPGVKYCDKEIVFDNQYNEPHFHYAEIPKHESLLLNGYFQSEKFFANYREEILKAFDIPYERKEGWISCHIRRGDYLLYPNCHKTVDRGYIQSAINKIKELTGSRGWKVLVVSDDIDWCIDNMTSMFTSSSDVEFSEGRTELEDLALASSCEHSIGSASSFSWWIWWLNRNENKIAVFPKKENWFGVSLPHNVDDLYDDKWILI